ncbi:MAG: hypothetical protein ACOC44_06560 [Promethearchaeia archaeon]
MHLIAHDIKNIMQIITLEVEMCKNSLNSPDKTDSLENDLQVIEHQVSNASKLVSNVVKFLNLDKEDIVLKKLEINQELKNKVAQIKERYDSGLAG